MFRQYQLELIINGRDRASRQIDSVNRSLGRMGSIVSGILIAETIRQVGSGISYLGETALQSYESLQKLGFASEALIAKELALGQIVRNTQQITSIDPEKQAELLEAQNRYELLTALIPEYQSKLKDLADEHGEASSQYIRTNQSLRAMQEEYKLLPDAITTLNSLMHVTKDIVTETRVGTMDMADAMKLAAPQAQQLTNWMERLAIRTPFDEDDVANTLRLAAAYNFSTIYARELATEEERLAKAQADGVVTAQRLTKTLLDFTAGTGLPEENIQQLALAFGQVEATGHLAGQEIRQFINAGLGISTMAAAMGITVAEFQALQLEGGILAEDLIPRLVEKLERDFGGAAERYMQTFPGIMQGLRTMTGVLLRDFFAPLFEIMTPKLGELFDNLSSPETRASIRQYGEDFAKFVVSNVERLDRMVKNIRELNREVRDFVQPKLDLITPEQREFLKNGAVNALIGFFGAKGIGAIRGVLSTLGFISGRVLILSAIGTGFRFLWETDWNNIQQKTSDAWEKHIKPAFEGIKANLTTDLPDGLVEIRDGFIAFVDQEGKRFVDFILLDAVPAVTDFADSFSQNATADLDAFVKLVQGDASSALDRLNYYLIIGKGEAKRLGNHVEIAATGLRDKLTPETNSYVKLWTSATYYKARDNAKSFYSLLTDKGLEGARIMREELRPETDKLGAAFKNLSDSGRSFFDNVVIRGVLGNLTKLTARIGFSIADITETIFNFVDQWASDTRLTQIIRLIGGELAKATFWVDAFAISIDWLGKQIEFNLSWVIDQLLVGFDWLNFQIHKSMQIFAALRDGDIDSALERYNTFYIDPTSREQFYNEIGRNRIQSGATDRFNGRDKQGNVSIEINPRNARDAELAIWQIARQARQQVIAIGQ